MNASGPTDHESWQMGFLTRLFSPREPARPILLRVVGMAGPPAMVEVETTWLPAGRVVRRSLVTAQGLCLLPWAADASRVRLSVRADGEEGRVDLGADDTADGLVHELRLG